MLWWKRYPDMLQKMIRHFELVVQQVTDSYSACYFAFPFWVFRSHASFASFVGYPNFCVRETVYQLATIFRSVFACYRHVKATHSAPSGPSNQNTIHVVTQSVPSDTFTQVNVRLSPVEPLPEGIGHLHITPPPPDEGSPDDALLDVLLDGLLDEGLELDAILDDGLELDGSLELEEGLLELEEGLLDELLELGTKQQQCIGGIIRSTY